ncbi:hypothetical protein [Winogradskyella sp. PE311]|uniref:hypothetical protein n=1 Tax=Winogradskyella sp. PE311 TaxID=3366943 RepID=UPI00398070C4
MKKSFISYSTGLILLSLLIIGCSNRNTHKIKTKDLALETKTIESKNKTGIPDVYYGIDTRHAAVTKAEVHNATTIYDFLNEGEKAQIENINSVKLTIIKDNQLSQIEASGTTDQLTNTQKDILKATEYFSHFTVRTEFKSKNKDTGKLEERFFGPHITVAPEKEATYLDGKESLIEYLKMNSKDGMYVIKDNKLGAIKLSFIVSKEGTVKDVKHDAMTTGYPSIDKNFMNLIKNIPGKWTPAENAKGEKMDFEFVFTFGPRDGC